MRNFFLTHDEMVILMLFSREDADHLPLKDIETHSELTQKDVGNALSFLIEKELVVMSDDIVSITKIGADEVLEKSTAVQYS